MAEAGATTIGEAALADPVVNVIVDLDTFQQHILAEFGGPAPRIDPAGISARRCETIDGVAVDPREAVALAMVGRVRRIVLDADDVIVNAGRLTRLYRGRCATRSRRCTHAVAGWLACCGPASRRLIIDTNTPTAAPPTPPTARSCATTTTASRAHATQARRMPNGWWIIHRPDGTPLQPPDAA